MSWLGFEEADQSVPVTMATARDLGPAPGAGGSFLETLGDVYARANPMALEADAAKAFGEDLVAGRLSLTYRAADRQAEVVDNMLSGVAAAGEAYSRRIRAVAEATGVTLENPESNGYRREASLLALDNLRRSDPEAYALVERSGRLPETGEAGLGEFRRRVFQQKLEELARSNPDKATLIRPGVSPMEDAKTIALEADKAFQTVSEGNKSAATTAIGALAGGMRGFFRDPLQVGTMLFGGGEASAARSVAWRIGETALREAAVNAGATALAQPAVQAWRARAGLESGVFPAIENIGVAALFGGFAGAGFRAGGEALRGLKDAAFRGKVERVLAGQGSPKEVRQVLEGMGARLTDEEHAALKASIDQAEADGEIPAAPKGITPADHSETLTDAIRHAEDPAAEPPPSPPIPRPAERAGQPVLADDRPATAELGQAFTYDGKPVTRESFDPRTLGTDASTFQYKGGGDDEGVTTRLRSVRAWDNLAAGNVVVFERADGTRVVADGHQRTGLARRLVTEDPSQNIQVGGFLFREVDGWTPADVRAIAAKKNIQEGSGSLLDTARVLRDRPDLWDATLPVSDERLTKARALSQLSPEAWGAVINGVIDPLYAAHIAALAPDPTWHAALVQELVAVDPPNEAAARFTIADSLAAGLVRETQETMFGLMETTASLRKERAAVFDAARKLLRQEKRLFATLEDQADRIASAGNELNRETNQARAAKAGELEHLVERLATRAGPVSEALNRAAIAHKEGAQKSKAAAQFVADLVGALERDGYQGLAAEPRLAPAQVIEPGSPEAAAQAEELLGPGLFDDPAKNDQGAASGGSPADRPGNSAEATPAPPQAADVAKIVQGFKEGQKGVGFDELYGRAEKLQEELGAAGDEIAAATGAAFKNPGVKDKATSFEKIARKGYKGPHELTDMARGGFIVSGRDQAEAVARMLAERFDVADEGWNVTPVGYADRKVLIRGRDGTIGEIQIIPDRIAEAKKEGHKLYSKAREMPPGPERDALDAQQVAVYSAAIDALGADWASVFGRDAKSSGPNVGSNAARQASSESTAPVSPTSSSSTGSQGPDGSSTANARLGDASSTAGRQSQLTNVGGDKVSTSGQDIGNANETGKSANDLRTDAGSSILNELDEPSQAALREALEAADHVETLGDLVASCKL